MFKKWFWLIGIILALFIYLSWQPPGTQAHEDNPPVWVWQNSSVQGNALNRINCVSSADCWAVGNSGTLLHYDGITWTQHSITFKNLYDISCVNTSFCFAVGQDQIILKYNGSVWTIDPFGLAENDDIYAINCLSTTFCMAGGFGEYFYKYDGLNWQRLPQPPPASKPTPRPQHAGFENIYTLKCLSSSLCFAGGEEHIWEYSGLSWSEVISEEEEIFRDLSCISATHCFAVMSNDGIGNAGTIWEYNGQVWEEVLQTPAWLLGISCFSEDYCATTGRKGTIYSYDGITWTLTASGVTTRTLNGLLCLAAGNCLAVGERGLTLTATNNIWQTQVQPVNGPTLKDVQCLSAIRCMALDSIGNFYWYDGYSWEISPGLGAGATAISCTGERECTLVKGSSIISFIFTPYGIFIETIKPLSNNGLNYLDISCKNKLDCWIVGKNISDGTGIIAGASGGEVNVPGLDRGLNAIACPAPNSCWAVGESGLMARYDGVQWQKQPDAPGFIDFTAISCVSVSECRAVGNDNDILTYNGTSWNVGTLPVPLYPTSLDCPASNYCYVVGQTGEGVSILRLQAGSWFTETIHNSYQLTAISCGNRLNCIAVGEQGTMLAKIASYTVTEPADNGNVSTEGTLSHALEHAPADYVINFQLPTGNSTVTISGQLPPVPTGVVINGGCPNYQPQITLQGQANAPGLQLAGQSRLYGLIIKNFVGPQLTAKKPGNRINCTLVQKQLVEG